ncbi:MAG: N-6 DNA methylase, partial [bacterium]
YPDLNSLKYPPYHITNPPYLYIGYIVKRSERNLRYFSGQNKGYQDLYQIALMNDLRRGLKKMIYIIPTNFLFGFSVSNKIRKDFLPFYKINKAFIFERKIFEFTGTNVCILFFERKPYPKDEPITFPAMKINHQRIERVYKLSPSNCYRAGGEFEEFVHCFRADKRLRVKFYLTLDEVVKSKGNYKVKLLDANSFANGYYKFSTYEVNKELYERIKSNPLFIRTLDTGSWEGRAGIYNVRDSFGVDGIVVTKEKYRTHPIQIFFTPSLSIEDLGLFKDYFNLMLEHLRDITDSEFMTTFKYSTSDYVRKYLGLSQVKKLIETFPLNLRP